MTTFVIFIYRLCYCLCVQHGWWDGWSWLRHNTHCNV